MTGTDPADFQLSSSGEWFCLITGELEDGEHSLTLEACTLDDGDQSFALEPGGGLAAEISGDTLTITMAGDYILQGPIPGTGTFTGEFIGQR